MSEQDLIVLEASRGNFNNAVILASHKRPILVEFMAMWSEPCVVMADHLVDMAREFDGQFAFAKVDIDEQTELRDEYSIANVPTLKVFKNGEVVHTDEGEMQPVELRALLRNFGIYHASDEIRMRLQSAQKFWL